MRTAILFMVLWSGLAFGQSVKDEKVKVFSFTPLGWKTDKVNGLAFGLGHFSFTEPVKKPEKIRVTNGLNLEVNPFGALLLMFQNPFDEPDKIIAMQVNGLHISTSGFDGRVQMNGLSVSLYSMGAETNGVSITGTFNCMAKLNGFHIAGMVNSSNGSTGFLIAPFNYAESFNGLEIGVVNQSLTFKGAAIGIVNIADMSMTGIQIGLINISGKNKGLQIGLWNKNAKRSLPIINW